MWSDVCVSNAVGNLLLQLFKNDVMFLTSTIFFNVKTSFWQQKSFGRQQQILPSQIFDVKNIVRCHAICWRQTIFIDVKIICVDVKKMFDVATHFEDKYLICRSKFAEVKHEHVQSRYKADMNMKVSGMLRRSGSWKNWTRRKSTMSAFCAWSAQTKSS